MPSAFKTDEFGPYIEADPESELDYSITTWLEDLLFTAIDWELSPPVAGALYQPLINTNPLVVDGKLYSIGQVASTWIKDLQAGQEYVVTLHATFTGDRKDDRSFRIKCLHK